MDGMAVVESAENQGAWEQRRILVSLRIERAGLQLMSAQGLDVTVDQIAREADISVRTFFRYFRNARDVLTAVPARESRRMCDALIARPAGENLLDGFHAWFHEMAQRDLSSPIAKLEAEAMILWSAIVRGAPELIQSESRAMIVLSANLEEVVRLRMGFGAADDEKVGVLSAALAAMIWYVYARSVVDGDPADLTARLDEAFDLLDLLHAGASA
jgi:AcrR family transcriptional regulator